MKRFKSLVIGGEERLRASVTQHLGLIQVIDEVQHGGVAAFLL